MPVPTSTTRENPRRATVDALQQWESGTVFADEVLHRALEEPSFGPFDRAFLTETFYGILRHRTAMDFLISQLRDTALDPLTRQILRLGFYQIFRMRIPHHAAVNETVNLAGRARGLVNALLRRSIREKEELLARLEQTPLAVRFSHPDFLVRRWEERYGAEATARLCLWNNTPAEIYARVNGLRVTVEELLSLLPEASIAPQHPHALKLRQVPHGAMARGLCYIQDPSTLLCVDLLDPQPGETVLDACAAPGGKSGYIAEKMRQSGTLYATDLSTQRLERLEGNLRRLGVVNAKVHRADWGHPAPDLLPGLEFDRILIDAPCSNTGVIRRRVDVRWRLQPHDFEEMPARQKAIAFNLVPRVRPGGVLVYSTCSLEPEENEAVVTAITARFPEMELLHVRRSLPHENGADGAFAALLRKRS